MPTAPWNNCSQQDRDGLELRALAGDGGREEERRKPHLVVYVSSKGTIAVHLKLAWCP